MPKAEPHVATDDECMRVIGPPGGEVRMLLVGAALLQAVVLAAARDKKSTFYSDPGKRPLRLAFGILDRIRTGEIAPWTCSLCNASYRGLDQLSALGVADHPGDGPKDPALTALVCVSCDQVSAEETGRRVREVFGISL